MNSVKFELDLSNKTNEDLNKIINKIKKDKTILVEDINKSNDLEFTKYKSITNNKLNNQLHVIENLIKEKKVLFKNIEKQNNIINNKSIEMEMRLKETEKNFIEEMNRSKIS